MFLSGFDTWTKKGNGANNDLKGYFFIKYQSILLYNNYDNDLILLTH